MSSTPEIILISPGHSSRMEYIGRFMASRLGVAIKLVTADGPDGKEITSKKYVLNYGSQVKDGSFSVFSNGLMFETGVSKKETAYFRREGQAYIFPSPRGFDLPFDLFSACFFLLSRYEEYLPFQPDQYGRFEADQSLAFRAGFLEEPVIDQWIRHFKNLLQQKFPALEFPVAKFRFISTFDIDNPWAFRHKGFKRNMAGSLKSLLQGRYSDFRQRMAVLQGSVKDPFDNYEYIRSMESNYNFHSVFFFLFGDYDRKDPNFAWNKNAFKDLVQNIGKDHRTGIHPSLRSNGHARLRSREYKRYSSVLGEFPTINRQHFLILNLPDTYRRLIEMGIKEDYSMGYASYPGFRAGTSSPFYFYDLASEFTTELVIFPFALMDVTLQQYLKLTPGEALEHIKKIIRQVIQAEGTFIILWHNESLSGQGIWKGWREVFAGMMEQLTMNNE